MCKDTKNREQNKKNPFFFMPRWSIFAIFDGKDTNNCCNTKKIGKSFYQLFPIVIVMKAEDYFTEMRK